MFRIHFTRALIVLTLIASLAALPAAAQAAPRVEDHGDGRGGLSLVRAVVDWVADRVTSMWGAGGPELDPTGGKKALSIPPPEAPTFSSREEPLDLQTSDGR